MEWVEEVRIDIGFSWVVEDDGVACALDVEDKGENGDDAEEVRVVLVHALGGGVCCSPALWYQVR